MPSILHFQFNMDFFLKFVFSPPSTLLQGLVLTVVAAILAQVLGTLIGTLLAVGSLSKRLPPRAFNQIYIWFFRGTPVLVQLVLIYFGLPYLVGFDLFPPLLHIGPVSMSGALLAGILAFGLHEGAYMSEITRAGLAAIDRGQTEAAQALGMSPALTLRRIVLPQAIPIIVPALGNQFNNMLKTTALLSVIGVAEMFRVAEQLQSATFYTFEVYFGISIYYLMLTAVWTLMQMCIEKWLAKSTRSHVRRAHDIGDAGDAGDAGDSQAGVAAIANGSL
ncbi:MAG: amino acid ABC transporter permease [Janthinobacterium lividum]